MRREFIDGIDRLPNFHLRFRGFDRTEVVTALAKLSSENFDARREIDRLGVEIERLQAAVVERASTDGDVQRAVIAVTKVADEIRRQAEESARQIQREAEDRGRVTVDRLREEARALEVEIDGLLDKRREVVVALESCIQSLATELDQVRDHSADKSAAGALAKTG